MSNEQEILEFSEAWGAAIVANDAQRIGAFMADEWIIVGENGATTKAEFLSWVASGEVTHEAMDMIGDARIADYGDTVIMSARVTNNGHYRGEPFASDEWTTDVFRRSPYGGWQCVHSHITTAKEY